jgi:protein-S-isoprenylcysteine O-methyltransferase Ste14
MSFVLIGLIIFFSFQRLGGEFSGAAFVNADILFSILYVAWILAELRVSKRETTQGDRTRDYGTCLLYAVGQAVVFLSALIFAPVTPSLTVPHILGLAISVSGVTFRLWAIRTLGRYYSHIVREVEDHRIVESGPYRVVRHPAYLGMIVANIGVVIFFFNPVTLALFLFLLAPAIVLRILIEERTLYRMEGYGAYAARRKRLMPGVW